MATVMIMELTLHSTKWSLTHLVEHEAKNARAYKCMGSRGSALMATVMIMEPTLYSLKRHRTYLPEHEAKGAARGRA